MAFEIYRSRQNPLHYVAVVESDVRDMASRVRQSKNLEFLTKVPDDGEPRIAFSAEDAKIRIAKTGFYAFRVTIEIRDSMD
jgi:hypothetical protein